MCWWHCACYSVSINVMCIGWGVVTVWVAMDRETAWSFSCIVILWCRFENDFLSLYLVCYSRKLELLEVIDLSLKCRKKSAWCERSFRVCCSKPSVLNCLSIVIFVSHLSSFCSDHQDCFVISGDLMNIFFIGSMWCCNFISFRSIVFLWQFLFMLYILCRAYI
jgi:hypothetical protein